MTETTRIFLVAALGYAARGWAVLPLQPREKVPFGKLVPKGFLNATSDPAIVSRWWAVEAWANIGIRTGGTSGLVVLDIDPRNGGEESLATLIRKHGALPETAVARTGGGGEHFFFQHPGGQVRSRPLAPGVDIKADGGYVVAAPSIHLSGHPYEWKLGAGPEAVALAPVPEWVLESLGSARTGVLLAKPISAFRQLARCGVKEGQRNIAVAQLVGHLLRKGVDPLVTLSLMLTWNQVQNQPPLPREEVIRTVDAIAGRELRRRQGKHNNE